MGRHCAQARKGTITGPASQVLEVACIYDSGAADVLWSGVGLAGHTANVSIWDYPDKVLGPFGYGSCNAEAGELVLEGLGLDPGTYVALVNIFTEEISEGVPSAPFVVS